MNVLEEGSEVGRVLKTGKFVDSAICPMTMIAPTDGFQVQIGCRVRTYHQASAAWHPSSDLPLLYYAEIVHGVAPSAGVRPAMINVVLFGVDLSPVSSANRFVTARFGRLLECNGTASGSAIEGKRERR